MSFKLLRDRVVMCPGREGKTQAAFDALQKTTGLRHQDANAMFRGVRTLGLQYLFQAFSCR